MSKKHLKIVLTPRFGNTHIHYDREVFLNGEPFAALRSKANWDNKTHPAWPHTRAVHYICAEDKKEWRRYYGNFDREITCEEFDDIPDERGKSLGIADEVVVHNPPFICPRTGIVWMYKEQELIESRKLWLFKTFPESTNGIWWVEYPIGYSRSDTAFLSGKAIKNYGNMVSVLSDPRSFLIKKEKINRMDIIKSAARKLKRMRIHPIPQATINFFKTLGAITHLNKRKPKTIQK